MQTHANITSVWMKGENTIMYRRGITNVVDTVQKRVGGVMRDMHVRPDSEEWQMIWRKLETELEQS